MMIKKKTLLAALSLLLLTAQLYAGTANAEKPDAAGLIPVSIKKNLYTGFVADKQGHIIAHTGDSGSESPVKDTSGPILTPEQELMIWGLAAGGALLFLLLLVWIPKRRTRAARKRREKAAAQSHAAHATLSVFLEGQDKDGQSFALRISGASIAAEGGVVIGRSPTESNVTINHPEVSRKQLRLFSDGDLLKIADLGSTNGTHVDGKHLGANEEAVLADRSRVAISHLQLSARLQQE